MKGLDSHPDPEEPQGVPSVSLQDKSFPMSQPAAGSHKAWGAGALPALWQGQVQKLLLLPPSPFCGWDIIPGWWGVLIHEQEGEQPLPAWF